MTEVEWNSCTDPKAMLEFLRASGRAGERKVRLFAVACCRRALPLLCDDLAERAVSLREGTVDDVGDEQELGRTLTRLQNRATASQAAGATYAGVMGVVMTTWALVDQPFLDLGLRSLANAAGWVAAPAAAVETDDWSSPHDPGWRAGWATERAAQAALLHDIFGPLTIRAATVDPSLLTWSGGLIPHLAQAAYGDRQLPEGTLSASRLAVLADALEEAGCADPEILAHLRGPGPHVRGCWVVDVLLDKA
jgi:hypothetical protein